MYDMYHAKGMKHLHQVNGAKLYEVDELSMHRDGGLWPPRPGLGNGDTA